MAFTDSGDDSPEGNAASDSSGTEPGGPGAPQGRGMPPEPNSGPILAALQRQARGPQVSTPGPGNMADSLGKLKIAIDLMQMSLNGFELESKQYGDILKALEALRRHLPEQGNESGLEQTHLVDLLRRAQQNPILQALSGLLGGGRGRGRQGGGGGGGGQGGSQQPPMPSTPLPGA